MPDSSSNSPQLADNESKDFQATPTCDISTTSSNVSDDGRGTTAPGGASHGSQGTDGTPGDVAEGTESSERTAVEKIHLLPISQEAPKAWVFAALTALMKERKTVRQYMYVVVKRPEKESRSPRKPKLEEPRSSNTPEEADAEYTYIVVACLPHSGVITASTIVFTSGSPLKPLRRIQLLALVHPNSTYARRAGVASYSEALQRGLIGGGRPPNRSSSSSSRREASSAQPASDTGAGAADSRASETARTGEVSSPRRHLGSPFDWVEPQREEVQQRRRAPRREYNRAEDVIAAVFDDSAPGSDLDSEDDDESSCGATVFRLSDAEQLENRGTESKGLSQDSPLQQQRTLQLNYKFPSSSSRDSGPPGNTGGDAGSTDNASSRGFSEEVLFYDFVAPYFRSRSAGVVSPSSSSEGDSASADTAVVVFPGKKLVIKDLTFVVWATDPDNAPGFLRKDTAVYISVDPWGEYRRVHILPFADTLPTTYSFRLFEDYLQPFLKEQPWRLIRKGDIFSYRGVEFKVIATEPSSVPVARVGPETMVHFEGTLNPSLIDILPHDILTRVRRLPARVQPFAIIAAAQSLDPQLLLRVLPSANMRGNQRGIDEGLEAAVERQLVRPFCLSEYQRQYAHLCTRRRKTSSAGSPKRADDDGEDSYSSRGAGHVPVQVECASTREAAAAVAEAAAGGWELEAPCCTVCTLQLQDGAESLTLTCGHAFHWGCARAWLRCSATCPNCRAEVALPSEDTEDSLAASGGNAGSAALGFVANAIADFFNA